MMELLAGYPPDNIPENYYPKNLVEFASISFGTKYLYFSPLNQNITDLMISACNLLISSLDLEFVESHLAAMIVSTISSSDIYAGVEGKLLNKLGLLPIPTLEFMMLAQGS